MIDFRNHGTSSSLGLLVTAAALLALTAGCGPGINVKSDYNPEVDFTTLRTFAWLPLAAETGDPRADSPILAGRVRRATVAELKAKGFREVLPQNSPDFYVTYQAVIDHKLSVRSTPMYAGGMGMGYAGYGYRGWGGRAWGGPVGYAGTQTSVKQYDKGTLILDVIDRERDDLIWRGSGQAKLKKADKRSSKERDQAAAEAVREILKDFPPTGS